MLPGSCSRSPDPRSDGAERAFKRHRGTISAWLPEKGFGFIAVPPSPTGPGRSVFLHWSEFRGPGLPVPGATVSFEMSSNAKGPCARQCVPVGGGGPSSAQQAATQRSSPKAGSSSSPATAAPTAGRATAAAAPPVRKTEFNAQAAYMAQSDMEPGQDDEQYRRARQRNSAFQKRHDVLFTAVIEDGITEEHDADTEASGSSKGKLAEVKKKAPVVDGGPPAGRCWRSSLRACSCIGVGVGRCRRTTSSGCRSSSRSSWTGRRWGW